MIEIRKFKMADLEDITELMTDLGYPTSLASMEQRMKKIMTIPKYNTFVAEHNARVVGMIGVREIYTYEEDSPFTQISALVTRKDVRGQGIGKKLINYVEIWAKKQGSKVIFLTSGNKPERESAHEFYKNVGFNINGSRFTKKLNDY